MTGSTLKIRWVNDSFGSGAEVVSVDFYYSVAGGNWESAGSYSAQNGRYDTYEWPVPQDFIHNQVRVRAVARYNTGGTAEAVSLPFNITDSSEPTVSISQPNGGAYNVGDPVEIQWEAACAAPYEVERVDLSFLISGYKKETINTLIGSNATSNSATWYPDGSDLTDKGQIGVKIWCSNCSEGYAESPGYFEVRSQQNPESEWTQAERPLKVPARQIPSAWSGGAWDQGLWYPEVVVDSGGNIHVASGYYDQFYAYGSSDAYYKGEMQIFYRKKTSSGTWQSQETATNYRSIDAYNTELLMYEVREIKMAVDSSGSPHIGTGSVQWDGRNHAAF